MRCVIGVDIGSVATKMAFLIDGKIINTLCVLTGAKAGQIVDETINRFLAEQSLDECLIVACGYGRNLITRPHEIVSEVKANIRGVAYQLEGKRLPFLVINIGGQDIKIVFLDEKGHMEHLIFNDKCAAGTGRFFETLARMLEIDLTLLSTLGINCNNTISVSSTCVVFAENEIINLLAKSHSVETIVASYNYSVAIRILDLIGNQDIPNEILVDGGVGLNKGFLYAVEKVFGKKVAVLPNTQLTTAIGAAIIGWKDLCTTLKIFSKTRKNEI